MKPADALTALLVMAIWGFNFVPIKVGIAQVPPLALMFLRFCLVAALLVPFVRAPRGRMLQVFGLSVTLGGLHFSLVFLGLAGIDAASAAIALQLQVPFSSLLAAILYKERLGWRRALGMAIAFAGIAVIAGVPRPEGAGIHLLMLIGASFAFAVANVQVRRIGSIDGLTVNGWMALFAAPQLLVATLLLESGQWDAIRQADWSVWVALAYIVLGSTVIAYGQWYRLVRRYSINQTMPFLLTIPVFGMLSGILVLGEPLTLSLMLGGALTISGVGLILLPGFQAPP